MQLSKGLLAAACAGLMLFVAHTAAQGPQPPAPAPAGGQPPAGGQQPPGGRGQGRGGQATFPAQQRPPGDPALIQRGQALYGASCRLCHGPDLRGGDMGGVNLLRSQLILNDQKGELILPVVRNGRQTPGLPPMPPFPQISDDDVRALAEYIHSVVASMRGQGAPPPGSEPDELNIVVGDAAAGEKYFAARCASCHSASGDLKGLASRIGSPLTLQNLWVSGGGRGGAPAAQPGAPNRREVRVTVTQASGEKVQGRLDRVDDFIVIL